MSCEESFCDALREFGIEYSGPIYIDGKLHRIKANGDHSKNTWYVLYPGPPVAGALGCWKRGFKTTWCERNGKLSQSDMQHVRQRYQEASEKLKAETVERQKKARKVAAWILNRSRPARPLHRYLVRKSVKIFGDVREYRGALVLPLRDKNGELNSLQFIAADGAKMFLSGGRVAGCFFTLTDKADGPLVMCEGYATGASVHEATGYAAICVMNSGNLLDVAKAARDQWPQREIIIAGDDDQFIDGNPGLTKATEAANTIGARLALPKFRHTSTNPTDFNDLHRLQGIQAVTQQIEEVPALRTHDGQCHDHRKGSEVEPNKSPAADEETIARLAALPALQYERVRKAEAEKLGCRESVLDHLVNAKRLLSNPATDLLQGAVVTFSGIESWPEAVNGETILAEIAECITRYVMLPAGAADALALWIAHTHCFQSFVHSPRLNASSPEKQSGKTTLRDVIAQFVPRPILTENMTSAVLFRLVSAHSPTLLADEYDAWIKDNEELRGLLNAGHRRGAVVHRCEGDGNEVRAFAAYAPAMLCGIGALPGTLHDRSIVVRLTRAKRGEITARFDERHVEIETELRRKLARWIADNRARIEAIDPRLPETAFNRLADNWRPIFAIAETAGGQWPERCADAFDKLTSSDDLDAHGVGTILLNDIAAIFKERGTDQMPSAELAERLAAIEGRPWAEWGRHRKAISPNQLANQLRRFELVPDSIKFGDKTLRGYRLTDFKEAFDRYLSQTPIPKCNSATTLGKTSDFRVQPDNQGLHPENAHSTRESCGVAPCTEGESENTDMVI